MRWLWIALSFNLILLAPLKIQADDPPVFQKIVEQHFNHWVHGGNDVLTEHRVNEMVLSPDVRGAEAAAIAAIHCYQKKLGNDAHALTLEFLRSQHKEDPSLRRDQAAVGANVSHNYSSFLKHIQSAPRRVFEVEHPTMDTITQGHLGDCYFVAAVGPHVHRNPDSIRQMIHFKDDHSYEIRFPNGQQVVFPRLTDAQLALGSNAGQQGVWLNVLELAAGIVENQTRKLTGALPLDTLGGGGDPAFSIHLLTGHKTDRHVIRTAVNGQHPEPAETEIPHLSKEIAHQIREGLDRHRIICCGVGEWSVPPGLIKKHVYAIMGLKQGHVEVWNPWGYKYHFEPNGAPGLQHGYYIEGGRFSVPINDFVKIFGSITVENDHPAK